MAQPHPVFGADGRPLDVEPTLGRVALPALGRRRAEEDPAAVHERRQALRAQALATLSPPGAAPPPAASPVAVPPAAQPVAVVAALPPQPALPSPTGPAPMPAPASAPASPAAKAALATAGVAAPAAAAASVPVRPAGAASAAGPARFALSTRRLRTRAESEQTMAAMQSLLTTAGVARVQVEIVPAGEDWRVIGWPFPQRAQAEKARGLLAARGMRLEVVDF